MPFINPNIEVTANEMEALSNFAVGQNKSVEQIIADEVHRIASRCIVSGYGKGEESISDESI